MAQHGDHGGGLRHVVHYAYPLKGTVVRNRPHMIEVLKGFGFTVRDAASGGGLILEHYRSVEGETFNELTDELGEWFSARGWDYDGWECELRPGDTH